MSTPDQVNGINPSGEYRGPSGTNECLGSTIYTNRVELSRPIAVIDRPKGRLIVRADALISDHDETISVGTAEHVHDGYLARFAQGLSMTLRNYEQDQHAHSPFLLPDHHDRFEETNSIFTPEEWETFKGQSGKSEEKVLEGMLRIAFDRFKLPDEDFQGLLIQFKHDADFVLNHLFSSFMANVTVDPGMRRVITDALENMLPVAVVSASQEKVVIDSLRYFGFSIQSQAGQAPTIDVVIGNAVKKIDSATFCGNSILRACEQLAVKPAEAIMFGDSIGDVAAAARAGIKTIFICPRSDADREGLKNQIENFQIQPRYNEELLRAGGGITVYLVSEFDQVDIEGTIIGEGGLASCRLETARTKKEA